MYCLIVEDERQTREGLGQLVRWHRIGIDRVAYAVNGREALQSIRKDPPDLVLCDIRMPYMNGVELLKHLREEGNNVPLIFMSGYSDKEYLMAAIRYRAVDYIEKPISIPVLSSALAKVVEKLDAEKVQLDPRLASRMVRGDADFLDIQARLINIGQSLAKAQTFHAAWLIQPQDSPGMPFRQLRYLLHEWDWPCLVDEETGQHSILVVGNRDAQSPDFQSLLTRINQIGGGYTLCVGMAVDALSKLPQSMEAARRAATRVFFRGEGQLYETHPPTLRPQNAAAACQTQLQDCLRNHHYPAVKHYLETLAQEWREAEGFYPEDAFDLLETLRESLLTSVLSRFQDQIAQDQPLEQRWLAVKKSKTLDQALEALQTWLRNLAERYLVYEQYSPAVMRALRYIADHYAEQFSAEDLAHAAFVSTSHLSYLFRQELGRTIKQYLRDVRTEKARCLLRDPAIKLSEIPSMVGIEDASYFAKLFRQAEGMTPSAYRERNLP